MFELYNVQFSALNTDADSHINFCRKTKCSLDTLSHWTYWKGAL